MYNWNTDTRELKNNRQKYTIWRLEQLINYGLNGEKIKKTLLQRYWKRLVIDPRRRQVLSMWLWPKQS